MLIVMALMPHYNEVPDTFPATVLYEFRQASFLTQLTLWAVLGVMLAEFVGRLSARSAADARSSRLPRSVPEPLRGPVSRLRRPSIALAGSVAGRRAGQAARRARPARGSGGVVVGLSRQLSRRRHRRTYGRWCSPATTA